MNFFQVYQKLRISCTKLKCELAYEFVHEFVYEFAKTKEKIRTRISEIRARILKEESNLCTNLNKQLDCIKTEIQRRHILIILWLVSEK